MPLPSPRSSASLRPVSRPAGPSGGAASSAHFRVVILGGGEAGLAVLESLHDSPLISEVALVEPSPHHYDQPAWMRVGTEGVAKEDTQSQEQSRVPPEATWIQDRVDRIAPEDRVVHLEEGPSVHYDFLVVALGTEVHWDRVRGLKEHLGSHGICSVYGYDQAERTWDMVRAFEGGRALFTAPSTPYKGGSAPLRLLFRAEEVWRETAVRDRTELFFATAASADVVTAEYAELIERSDQQDDIHVFSGYDLIEVRPDAQEAVFRVAKGHSQSQDVLRFDFLHVVPPMRPPALLEDSDLAHRDGPRKGYLAVHPESLRHERFDTVFGVGDVAGLDGVKTGARAREQGAAVARRLRRLTTPDE